MNFINFILLFFLLLTLNTFSIPFQSLVGLNLFKVNDNNTRIMSTFEFLVIFEKLVQSQKWKHQNNV